MTRNQILFCMFSLTAVVGSAGVHRISLKAVDAETGEPVPGLSAGAAFNNTAPLSWASRWMKRQGETDEDGCFSAIGFTTRGQIRFGIDPSPEYYGQREDVNVNALEPLISRTYRLRRRHPTELIEVNAHVVIALTNGSPRFAGYQFDLLRRSFLPPYGTGTVADVEFRLAALGHLSTPEKGTEHRYEISFPGEGNGGVLRKRSDDTDFIFDRIEDAELTNVFATSACKDCRLGFRIRSRRDGEGRLVGAHYGYFMDVSRAIRMELKEYEPWVKSEDVEICFECRLNPVPGENNLESFAVPKKRYYTCFSFPETQKENR